MKRKHPPFLAIVLIVLLIFQSVSALYGGILLIIDPTGALLKLPSDWLKSSIFPDFLIPGIILSFILGVFPGFAAFCIVFKSKKAWVKFLNIYPDKFPGWTYSLYSGLLLIIWITIQISIIGYGHIIQTIYACLGILIIILVMIPGVITYYTLSDEPEVGIWRTL
jgi:hypothetical protein